MRVDSVQHSIRQLLSPHFYQQLWKQHPERSRLLELPVFALLVPVLGLWLFPADPFVLNAGFAWAAALPLWFAARYGTGWGLGCGGLTALTVSVPLDVYAEQTAQVMGLAVGIIVLCILVGDAASEWRRRARQAEAENHYLRHRLKEFSNDYHVLKVSHGQLEECMAGQRLSLRMALQSLKPVLSANSQSFESGNELMAIFAQFCSVQIAGLYAMDDPSTVNPQPVATHGDMPDLPLQDPLLMLALEQRQLVSVKLDSVSHESHHSGLLAVVPIVDSQGFLHGVLAVQDMHFMAYQQDNLNVLALLGGYVGDMLTRSRAEGQDSDSWFRAELTTATRFARSHGVQSALVCLTLPVSLQMEDIARHISDNIRSLDCSWYPEAEEEVITLAILLPLMSETQCTAYRHRLASSIKTVFAVELESALIHHSVMQIDRHDSPASCLEFVDAHMNDARQLPFDRPVPPSLSSAA